MENEFCIDKFMNWLKEKFPEITASNWHYDLVENIIDYALENKNMSKDQFALFVSDMLPGVNFSEVVKFYDNDCSLDPTTKQLDKIE